MAEAYAHSHGSLQARIQSVHIGDGKVSVLWEDGHKSEFHNIWLRDNCYCTECGGDPINNWRLLLISEIPLDVHPASWRIDDKGDLCITWMPSHQSVYSASWLRDHCYCCNDRVRRRHQPILWTSDLTGKIPEIDFQDAMSSEDGQLRMLELVRDYGFALIRNSPPTVGTMEEMAAQIGFVREFNYGRVFDIEWKDEQKSIAYSKQMILPHTDEPFRYHPPGISLFHCLKSSSDGGGESILVDGFTVVEALRRIDPEAVDLLSKVPQSWYMRHVNGELYRGVGRMICLDVDGRVVGVRFNERCQSPVDLPGKLVEPFYAALRKLSALYRDPTLWVRIMLSPGDLLVYDNERVLHGRTSFTGTRHLRLCAVERDEFHSRLRVLGQRLGRRDSDLIMAAGVGA